MDAKRSAKENFVSVCPECNSTNISMDHSNALVGAMGLPADFICKDCGFTSKVFPEMEESEAKKLVLKKIPLDTKTEKVDVSYGRFEVNIIWKIGGPIFILIGLFMIFTYDNSRGQSLIIPIGLLAVGIILVYFGFKKK